MSVITPGMTAEKTILVTEENTAAAMGSGTLPVFATPAMIALCENTCATMVEELLGEGITSVGTRIDIEHLSASPIGTEITCKATLTAFDGRRLDYTAEVYDNAGLIGKGAHTRFTVKADSFLKKANAKLNQ